MVIVIVRALLRPDPLAHSSWQIVTENILLMPGLFILGPIFGSPEDPTIAWICYWGIMIISAAVYAVPFALLFEAFKSLKAKNP